MSSLSLTRSLNRSFLRAWTLVIDNNTGSSLQFGNVGTGGHAVRCAFNVERKGAGIDGSAGGTSPGARSIVLTNLSPLTRNKITSASRCTLKVGYGQNPGTLFIGTVKAIRTERRNENVDTTLELIDGESFSAGCSFIRSFAPSTATKLTTILSEIVKTMQLTYYPEPVRIEAGVAVGLREQTYLSGFTFNGTCGDALNLLLKPQGLTWNISNGALNILAKDGYDRQQAFVLRPETGLINTPADKINATYTSLTFQSLMNTQLTPNRLICFVPPGITYGKGNVVSAIDELTGFYKIIHTVHRGDTHGQAWDVSCEALRYTGDVTVVNAAVGFDYTKALS